MLGRMYVDCWWKRCNKNKEPRFFFFCECYRVHRIVASHSVVRVGSLHTLLIQTKMGVNDRFFKRANGCVIKTPRWQQRYILQKVILIERVQLCMYVQVHVHTPYSTYISQMSITISSQWCFENDDWSWAHTYEPISCRLVIDGAKSEGIRGLRSRYSFGIWMCSIVSVLVYL